MARKTRGVCGISPHSPSPLLVPSSSLFSRPDTRLVRSGHWGGEHYRSSPQVPPTSVGYPMPPECLWPLRPYAGGERGSPNLLYSRAISIYISIHIFPPDKSYNLLAFLRMLLLFAMSGACLQLPASRCRLGKKSMYAYVSPTSPHSHRRPPRHAYWTQGGGAAVRGTGGEPSFLPARLRAQSHYLRALSALTS